MWTLKFLLTALPLAQADGAGAWRVAREVTVKATMFSPCYEDSMKEINKCTEVVGLTDNDLTGECGDTPERPCAMLVKGNKELLNSRIKCNEEIVLMDHNGEIILYTKVLMIRPPLGREDITTSVVWVPGQRWEAVCPKTCIGDCVGMGEMCADPEVPTPTVIDDCPGYPSRELDFDPRISRATVGLLSREVYDMVNPPTDEPEPLPVVALPTARVEEPLTTSPPPTTPTTTTRPPTTTNPPTTTKPPTTTQPSDSTTNPPTTTTTSSSTTTSTEGQWWTSSTDPFSSTTGKKAGEPFFTEGSAHGLTVGAFAMLLVL